MFKEYTNGQFIFGKGTLYEDVLEDFKNTKYIGILTFDITTKENSELLKLLKEASKRNVTIQLITNIPKRFNDYYYTHNLTHESIAQRNINAYLNALEPTKYGKNFEVYFSFENHSKIIVTDSKLYFGSSNFSDESKNNYECGIVISDKDTINLVKKEIIPKIISSSVPYYNYNIVDTIMYFQSVKDLCADTYKKIAEKNFYSEDNEIEYSDKWKYCSNTIVLNNNLINEFEKIDIEYEKSIEIILSIIRQYEENEKYEYSLPEEVEKLRQIINEHTYLYETLKENVMNILEESKNYSNFDTSEQSFKRLNERYSMEAYDEYLDDYLENVVQEVEEEYYEIVKEEEKSVRNFINILILLQSKTDEMIKLFLEVLDINKKIDNTGLLNTAYSIKKR